MRTYLYSLGNKAFPLNTKTEARPERHSSQQVMLPIPIPRTFSIPQNFPTWAGDGTRQRSCLAFAPSRLCTNLIRVAKEGKQARQTNRTDAGFNGWTKYYGYARPVRQMKSGALWLRHYVHRSASDTIWVKVYEGHSAAGFYRKIRQHITNVLHRQFERNRSSANAQESRNRPQRVRLQASLCLRAKGRRHHDGDHA